MRAQYEIGHEGEILFYPVEGRVDAVPAPTVEAHLADDTVLFAAEDVPLGAFSQDVEGVDADHVAVSVDDGTGAVVGERLWLATSGGRGREFELLDVEELAPVGHRLQLDKRIGFSVGVGTISSHALRRTLTVADTAREARLVAVTWRYSVRGRRHAARDTIDIVQSPWDVSVPLDHIEDCAPDFGEAIGEFEGWQGVRREARRWLWREIARTGLAPDRAGHRDIQRDVIAWQCLLIWAQRERTTLQVSETERGSLVSRWTAWRDEAWHQFADAELWARQWEVGL